MTRMNIRRHLEEVSTGFWSIVRSVCLVNVIESHYPNIWIGEISYSVLFMYFAPTIRQSINDLGFLWFFFEKIRWQILRSCLLNLYRQNASSSTGETFAYWPARWDVKCSEDYTANLKLKHNFILKWRNLDVDVLAAIIVIVFCENLYIVWIQ